jgi:hypothetical protein
MRKQKPPWSAFAFALLLLPAIPASLAALALVRAFVLCSAHGSGQCLWRPHIQFKFFRILEQIKSYPQNNCKYISFEALCSSQGIIAPLAAVFSICQQNLPHFETRLIFVRNFLPFTALLCLFLITLIFATKVKPPGSARSIRD